MADKIKLPFKGFHMKSGEITVDVNMARIEKQFQQAQYLLDSTVMMDMQPYMPMLEHKFIDKTVAASQAIAGSGKVYAAMPPEGRFLYEGKTMVDAETGSPWARKAAQKVLVSQFGGKTAAKEELTYSHEAHPKAQSHWFEAAKEQHGDHWIRMVKKIAGGGSGGA